MATYRWSWTFPCPRQALWPVVSDTDWVNKRAGLPPVRYEYQPLATGGSRTKATVSFGPVRVQWYEPPFEWSEPDYYTIERRYLGGPLKTFESRTELSDDGMGTRIDVTVAMQARSPFYNWVLPIVAWYGKTGADRAFRAAAARVAAAGSETTRRRASPPLFGRAQLRAAGFSDELLDKLAVYLESAEDRDLAKMRAYELADRWKEPRKSVLHLFLTATRFGLLNLSWDVMCGACRGTKLSARSLDQVTGQVHCDACNLQFGAQFDRSVEVTFNAHPLGKGLNVPAYCMAGPHTSRFVVAQEPLRAGASGSLDFGIEPGRYVATVQTVSQLPFAVEHAMETATIPLSIGIQGLDGIPAVVQASRLALQVQNSLDRDVLLRIAQSEWPDTIVTAADVTAMQEFRDLFSSEVLASGLELSIESMTVLFTDLVGSTELYSRSGDAPAFRIVNDHFDQMRAIVQQYDGAIVKTIGDAIMAVFRDSGNCLEAALRLPAAVGMVECDGGKLMLRVGFHTGPCIAMRANDRLDYFGTTVNLASRLEHSAAGGEVAFTESTAQLPHMQRVMKNYRLHPQQRDVLLKGFKEPLRVYGLSSFGST